MAILPNPRHEKCRELVVSGTRPSLAYASIGYSVGGASLGLSLR